MRLQVFRLPEDRYALVVDKFPADQGEHIGRASEVLRSFAKDCGLVATLVTSQEVEVA